MHFVFTAAVYFLAVFGALDIAEVLFQRLRRSWEETIPSFDGPANRYRQIEIDGIREKDRKLAGFIEETANENTR